MKPTKKLLTPVGALILAGAALASAAVAADNSTALDSSVSAFSASAMNAVSSVSLPASASETATRVLDAIAGGSTPSMVASKQSDSDSPGQAKGLGASLISAAQRLAAAGTAGTVGMRPGWGCGDKNHEHSGPPGRPNADRPPGCDK